jgi:hypothetical protein
MKILVDREELEKFVVAMEDSRDGRLKGTVCVDIYNRLKQLLIESSTDKKLDEAIKAINTPDNNWTPEDGHNLLDIKHGSYSLQEANMSPTYNEEEVRSLYFPNYEIAKELAKQKEWTLEILDMLIENEAEKMKQKGLGGGFESMLSWKLNKLKVKLVGEK